MQPQTSFLSEFHQHRAGMCSSAVSVLRELVIALCFSQEMGNCSYGPWISCQQQLIETSHLLWLKTPDLLQCLQINLLCDSHLLYPAIHILKILHTTPSLSLEDRSTVLFSLIKFQYVVLTCQLLYFVAYALNKFAFLWTKVLFWGCLLIDTLLQFQLDTFAKLLFLFSVPPVSQTQILACVSVDALMSWNVVKVGHLLSSHKFLSFGEAERGLCVF